MKTRSIVLLLLMPAIATAAAHFPFPQNTVSFGICAADAPPEDLQSVYQYWMGAYYAEEGNEARIRWDTPTQTVSEGIGYGMLIMATMDNSVNNTRPKFDKLWNYYKKWRDGNGLMNWKIDGFNSVVGGNAATDADLDAAAALVLAYRQWADETYLADAKTLIEAIWDHEVNGNKFLKPGDAFDSNKNPSYFSTGALELFKSIDSHDWDAVIRNSYSLVKKVSDPATGLVPDWCSEDGGSKQGDFGYDAVRVPWRMAWAYSWYGHKDAADIDSKIASWICQLTDNDPGVISAGYTLAGTAKAGYSNATYTGCLSCAGMVSASFQEWVNKAFYSVEGAPANGYYNKTLQVLTMLQISGNFTPMSRTSGCKISYSSLHRTPAARQVFVPLAPAAGRFFSLNGRTIAAFKIPPQALIKTR